MVGAGRPGQPAGQAVFFLFYMKIVKNDVEIKESGPGTFIFEFSVKFQLEWYQFHSLSKTKTVPNL